MLIGTFRDARASLSRSSVRLSIAAPAASAPNNQAGKGESSWPLALAQIRINWDWARVTAT